MCHPSMRAPFAKLAPDTPKREHSRKVRAMYARTDHGVPVILGDLKQRVDWTEPAEEDGSDDDS